MFCKLINNPPGVSYMGFIEEKLLAQNFASWYLLLVLSNSHLILDVSTSQWHWVLGPLWKNCPIFKAVSQCFYQTFSRKWKLFNEGFSRFFRPNLVWRSLPFWLLYLLTSPKVPMQICMEHFLSLTPNSTPLWHVLMKVSKQPHW